MDSKTQPPKKNATLRSTLNRVMLLTLGLVSVLAVGVVFGYAQIKQSLAEHALMDSLTRSAPSQIEALLPSLLVPEQRSGANVFLERFKESDKLENMAILASEKEFPAGLIKCSLLDGAKICLNHDGTQVAALIPIRESGQDFGYLLKMKRVPNPLAGDHLLQIIEFTTGALLLSFLLLFVFLTRITAHEVPNELANLVSWVEDSLNGKSSLNLPTLKYRELNELGAKIAEIIHRHDKARDEAFVGQLTSGIMHDIKTPLHSIVTAHGLVAEQPLDSPKRMKRLENLARVSGINLPIIGNIIESTLDGVRQIHIEPKNIDLRQTIRESIELHNTSLHQREAQVEFDSGAAPVLVDHDAVQMGRVFSNVIKNSIEAFDGCPVDRAARPARIRLSIEPGAEGFTKVVLEDSGPGLPEDPERVFRVFRSSKPRGSGLGLVVSRRIVEAHRGALTASHSTSLFGARFEVTLPNKTTDGVQFTEDRS
jgi:signal transduction histidine kinase